MAPRPWSFTCCCRSRTSALTSGSFERIAYGKTYSSGSTSSRQNSSTQSSFFWNSGSVEKSQAIRCVPRVELVLRGRRFSHRVEVRPVLRVVLDELLDHLAV